MTACIFTAPNSAGIGDSEDSILIIAIAVGLGAAVLIAVFFIGLLSICALCWRRKKNYRKYILPYRAYMDGKADNSYF
jgi:hypothetical protein